MAKRKPPSPPTPIPAETIAEQANVAPPAETAEARKQRLQAKITKLLALREKAKKAYGAAGSLLNELIRDMAAGETVTLADGRTATMKDAFARANYVYRNTSFTRLDLEVTG